MAGLYFDIRLDDSNFKSKIQQVNNSVKSANITMESLGLTTASFSDKLASLSEHIQSTQSAIDNNTKKFKDLSAAMSKALETGDTKEINAISDAMLKTADNTEELTSELNNLKSALSVVEQMSGLGSSMMPEVTSPQLYANKGDYDKANALRDQANSLKAQIAESTDVSEADMNKLRESLSATEAELRKVEASAADAAAKLGADLGARAAEASESLYRLDDAIKEQQSIVNSLSETVKTAAAELQALKDKNADDNEIKTAQAAYDGLSTSLNNAQNELRNLQAAQEDAKSQWAQVSTEVAQHDSVMVRMLGGYDKYTAVISHLPAPLQSVIGGLQGMTGAAKAFIATPLGAVIAAIVLALQTLKTWFDSSVEGQMALAKVSGYVGGVLNQLKEIVIKVGETIYKAFTNPKRAVSELWEAIKTNLINRVKAVGGIFVEFGKLVSSALSFDWEGTKSHFRGMTDQMTQLATGVENLSGKIGQYVGKIHDAASATAEIAKANKELDIEEHEWGKRRAELEKIKAEAQAKMYDTSISAAQRKKAMEEFEGALQEQYDKEREFADRRIELQEQTMGLTTNAIEDENKLRDLQAARLRLDAQQAQEMASLQRRKNSINNSERSAENAAQKQVELQQKLNADLQKLRDKNFKTEVEQMDDGQEKAMKIIEANYQARKTAIEKQITEFAKLNKKAGVTDVNENGLTAEQQSEVNKTIALNESERKKSIAEVSRAEISAMRDYLKEYGTYQQQKLAIAEEYAEKIRKAQTEGERLALEKEREKMMAQMSLQSISMNIDWSALLKGVGNLSQDMMRPMLDQLTAYSKTAEFNAADIQEREKVISLIRELQQYIGTESKSWTDLAKATTDFTDAVNNYNQLKAREETAYALLSNAANKLASGEISQEAYQLYVDTAEQLSKETKTAEDAVRNFGVVLNETSDAVGNQVSKLSASLEKARTWQGVKGFDAIESGAASVDALKSALDMTLPNLADGLGKNIGASLSSTLGSITSKGLETLTAGMGSVVCIVAQIPQMILDIASAIKNMVTGVLNSLSEILSLRWIDDLVVSILDAIGNLVDTIFDLPENIAKMLEAIIVDGIGGLLDGIVGRLGNVLSFGLLSSGGPSEWLENSNAKEVAATTARLVSRNELLTKSIDALTDEMGRAKGMQTVDAYKQAVAYQKETNENYKVIAQAQAGYHGSHHSWEYYWQGFTDEQIDRLSKQIGRQWSGDIWDLTPEEMKALQSNVDMWEQILNTGKGGYGERLGEKLEDYIAQAGQIDELTDELKEKLTGITFDSMYDSFIDKLMDMDAKAEDIADNVAEYFMRAMLSNKIGEIYEDELKKWYDDFAEAMGKEGGMTDAEIAALNQRYSDIVNSAIEMRDELASLTGYDKTQAKKTEQQATAGGYETMSESTGQELNGRFAAFQDSNERIAQSVLMQVESLRQLAEISTASNETLKSLLLQAVLINDYLDTITAYGKIIVGFGDKLDKIVTNTKEL